MRGYRRNADEKLRELERLAAQGDREAQAAVVRELLRTGQGTLQWLAAAGSHAARHLPEELADNLLNTLILSRTVPFDPDPPTGPHARPNGWFPKHRRQDVCPRGHGIGDDNPFTFHTMGDVHEWIEGYDANEDTLYIGTEWDSDHAGTGVAVVSCGECNAHWPAGEVQG